MDNKRKLKLIEDSYKVLVDNMNDYALILLDTEGNVIFWNNGAERIKGYSKEEILGRHFSLFYPREMIEAGYPEYELKKAKTDGRFEDEGWRIKKDGSKFWANVIISPIYDNDAELLGYSKITRDLTDKRKNEETLRKSEDKYKLLVEGIKDYAIFMLDPNGLIASWNEGARRLKGYEESEIIGKHFSVFYTEKAKREEYPQYELKEAIKKGRYEDEGIRVRKDGTTFFANVVITAMYNKEKDLIGFSKVTRDLTEKKNTEEALRASEQRYRLLVEGVKDYAIYMLDPNGFITTWNAGAKKLKGYDESEIIGKHFSIFYTQEAKSRKYPQKELKEALKSGRFENEGLRVRKDGSTFFANVVVTALYNSDHKHIGFSKITRDLTLKKQTEQRLQEMNTLLEKRVQDRTEELSESLLNLQKINSDLDSFIYTASHDLKAPVSNIEGLVDTLKEILKENKIQRQDIDQVVSMIRQSISKFQGTIQDLAEINRTQKNESEAKTVLNIAGLIEDIKISILNLIQSANVSLQVDTALCPEILFSRMHMNSILYNLIINAIKYKAPGRNPVISIRTYTVKAYSVIEVRDNGLGIKTEDKGKIFNMFKRLHDHVEGTGVGLYIVKRLVDNAKGKIEVESELGSGTVFRIYLPRDKKKIIS